MFWQDSINGLEFNAFFGNKLFQYGSSNIDRCDLYKSFECNKRQHFISKPQLHLFQWRDIFCVVDANKQYVTMHKYEVVKYNLLVLSDLVAQ